MKYQKENEKHWKIEAEDRLTERQKKEKRNREKQNAEKIEKEKKTQQKIKETWKRLPEHEQRHLLKEEETRRRFELREVKVNIWKKWRNEKEEKKKKLEESQKDNQKAWLEKLENTVERLKAEVEERRKSKELYEERRQRLLDDNKRKQEEMLTREQEKKDRKEKKKMLEERWAMARWIASYIDENTEKWKAGLSRALRSFHKHKGPAIKLTKEEKVLHPRREVVFPSFLFAHVLTIQIDKTRTLDKLKSFFSKNFHRA